MKNFLILTFLVLNLAACDKKNQTEQNVTVKPKEAGLYIDNDILKLKMCNEDKILWLSSSEADSNDIKSQYKAIAKIPLEVMYVKIDGSESFRSEVSSLYKDNYKGSFDMTKLYELRKMTPEDCNGDLNKFELEKIKSPVSVSSNSKWLSINNISFSKTARKGFGLGTFVVPDSVLDTNVDSLTKKQKHLSYMLSLTNTWCDLSTSDGVKNNYLDWNYWSESGSVFQGRYNISCKDAKRVTTLIGFEKPINITVEYENKYNAMSVVPVDLKSSTQLKQFLLWYNSLSPKCINTFCPGDRL